MPILPLTSVTFRKDGVKEEISLENMTKQFYNQYREFIFCPNPDCDAKIEFAEGPKRKFLRTKKSIVNGEEIIEQHDENCLYAIMHDRTLGSRRRYDASILVGISDKHRDRALRRAFRKLKDPDFGKRENQAASERRKSKRSKVDEELPLRGKLSLITPVNDDGKSPKESPLFQRNINEIGESDFGEVRTVSGFMADFVEEENYKYIILENDIEKNARVFFGEYFRANNNEVQYGQLKFYKQYFEEKKQNGEEVAVACIGEIKKDDYDISVVINNYKDIYIDELTHYQLISKYIHG